MSITVYKIFNNLNIYHKISCKKGQNNVTISLSYNIIIKYHIMKKFWKTAIWIVGLLGLIWLTCAQFAKATDEEWIKEKYFEKVHRCEISHGVIDNISQKMIVSNTGSDWADISYQPVFYVNGCEYDMIQPYDWKDKSTLSIGDTVYIHQLFDDECVASREILPASTIEGISSESVAAHHMQWQLIALVFLLIAWAMSGAILKD